MKNYKYLGLGLLTALLTLSIACDISEINNSQAIQSFTVNTSSVAPSGSVTLNWKTTGADQVIIDNGIGTVPNQGSKSITFEEIGSYTYTLTAVTSGTRETATVTISCEESVSTFNSRVINHTCTDPSLIPEYALDLAKTRVLFQYLRYGPKGDQILIGLDELEAYNPLFVSAVSECNFSSEYPALRIMNGLWALPAIGIWGCTNYISPENFWGGDGFGLLWYIFNYLSGKKPYFNASIWMWEDIGGYSHLKLARYTQILDRMDWLINWMLPMFFPGFEYPKLNFVISTAPADTPSAIRYERNQEIRKFAGRMGFYLLDIEDIECWYNGEQHLVDGIPTRHPHYADDGSGGGTNADLRIAKATAFWYLSAFLSGWDGN
jgi:PKD repeat protein